MEKLASIRGAITVKENSIKEIKNSTTLLLTELLKQNKLDKSKIINIIFYGIHTTEMQGVFKFRV